MQHLQQGLRHIGQHLQGNEQHLGQHIQLRQLHVVQHMGVHGIITFGQNGRNRVKSNYTHDMMRKKYLQVYSEVV